MRFRKKKGDEREPEPVREPKRLTPVDIQQVVFRRALFRGYREEEVDDFLDRVTEAVALLLEDQRRLREQAPGAPAPAPAAPASGTAPPADLSPFLHRERTFLRELAQIIQNHAEAMKGMVQATRAGLPPPEAPAPPAKAAETEQRDATVIPEAAEAETSDTAVLSEGVSAGAEASFGQSGDRERSLKELFWGED
jgi:DivIVA domain-containing protein